MKKFILILFSYGGLKEINEHIKKKVSQNDILLVRAVIIENVPKLFEHLISDVGFLGEQVVSDVEDSVVDIYQDNAKDYLEEVREIAAIKNFKLDPKLIEQHNLVDLRREIEVSDLDEIFINFSDNEFVSNQVKEEEIKSWLKKISLHQDIFYDGKIN